MRKLGYLLSCATLAASPTIAEELAIVGSWSSLPLHSQFEEPFWTKALPDASNGQITTTLTTHDQASIAPGDVYRLLGEGVYDIAMTVADYAVADAPELEGLDVPLIALDAGQARAAVDAAGPMVEDIYNARFNSHVLAIVPYPPQIVFCNKPIAGLADLKGLKVRGSGRMTTKFLEALGAEGINIAFGEVPGALQKGVIDCAITGGGSGYSAGWWEVSTHLLALPLGGWDHVVVAVNLDKWNGMSAENKALIEAGVKADFEEKVWETAQGALENDIACLTGNGTCSSGETRSMTLVAASADDLTAAIGILETKVLPDWADRAGPDWTKRWNESIGNVGGLMVPVQ